MSSKARKVETSQPVCAACGGVATRGGMGFLAKIATGKVSDATGKQFSSDDLFHGYHIVVIGPEVRARLDIPDDILEMTVSERLQWEREYESE